MLKTLFLNPPSYEGFDGGAGARYQTRREVRSFWYPTWLAQPAAMVPGSKLIDAPPDDLTVEDVLKAAGSADATGKPYELCVIHTTTPTCPSAARLAADLKQRYPAMRIGFVGAHGAVLPEQTLREAPAIEFACGKEFDYTLVEIAEGRPLAEVNGITYRAEDGSFVTTPPRALIHDLDALPSVLDVYRRDLTIPHYFNGYLQHPYLSLYTGRGCPAQCTFCLWPQTIGGHKYRVRSPQNVADEMAYMKKLFPQVREFFFDDDTFTANLPRAREIAEKLGPLGVHWSCNSRANLDYDTIKSFKDNGLRLFLVGYESGNDETLTRIKKGVTTDEMRRFTQACHQAGVIIHGTFILGLPMETKESIEQTIRFAQELDVFSIQVSLAAPYPGTELYEQARLNGWFAKKDKADLVEGDGFQQSALEYPGLTKDEIFEKVERFYRRYYLHPRPILRIVKTMLEDKDVCVRRLREGFEFFKSMAQRRSDLEAAKASLA
jgi:hopanoid biosynthesis associated radical SAM protein HpnJ